MLFYCFDPKYINEKDGEFGEKILEPNLPEKPEIIFILICLKWELRLDQVVCKKCLKKYIHVKRMSRMIQPLLLFFINESWQHLPFSSLLFTFL